MRKRASSRAPSKKLRRTRATVAIVRVAYEYYNLYAPRKSLSRVVIQSDSLKDKLQDIWRLVLQARPRSSVRSQHMLKSTDVESTTFFFFPFHFFFFDLSLLFFSSREKTERAVEEPRFLAAYHHGPIKSITRPCLLRVTLIRNSFWEHLFIRACH